MASFCFFAFIFIRKSGILRIQQLEKQHLLSWNQNICEHMYIV